MEKVRYSVDTDLQLPQRAEKPMARLSISPEENVMIQELDGNINFSRIRFPNNR